ncbi:hypothetical protein F1559_001266 [Cyanidiococcus yangmingshanensis]|uniref:Phosphotyrosine protein phosphatase I domain-containing protein n=1 Tax=Cyanidiococcus yangmingshanensis TaxID=2690220 RepID=A0A7J7IEZ0_9RHOD|nr:hypothetical protein F1559_001266 [Cyanidiococcus yangmingshanensis]
MFAGRFVCTLGFEFRPCVRKYFSSASAAVRAKHSAVANPCGRFTRSGFTSERQSRVCVPSKCATFSSTMSSTGNNEGGNAHKFSILTVCLGNLCRSPAAEAILKKKIHESGLEQLVSVDSCGTGGGNPNWYVENGWSYHEGDRADSRMIRIAAERNLKIDSISRPMKPADLENFDLIVVMDAENESEVQKAASYWGKKYAELAKHKVQRITKYCKRSGGVTEVPDPWYNGGDSMRRVLDILENACDGLFEAVRNQISQAERK